MVIMVTTDYTFRDRQTDTKRESVHVCMLYIYAFFWGGTCICECKYTSIVIYNLKCNILCNYIMYNI